MAKGAFDEGRREDRAKVMKVLSTKATLRDHAEPDRGQPMRRLAAGRVMDP